MASPPADAGSRPRRGVLAGAVVALVVLIGLFVPAVDGTAGAVTGAGATGETWGAELAVSGGDDVGVALVAGALRLVAPATAGARAAGVLVLAPRRVAAPTTAVTADLTADVPPGTAATVEVRGVRSDGSWSSWLPTGTGRPAVLPETTTQLQARIRLLGGAGRVGPAVQRLWLSTSLATPATTLPAPTAATTPAATTPAASTPAATNPGATTSTSPPGAAARTAGTADLLWSADVTAQGVGRFNDTPWNFAAGPGAAPPGATVVPDAAGRRAVRFSAPVAATAAQLEPNTDNDTEGLDRWFRLSVRPVTVPADPRARQVVGEWKNNGDGAAPLELAIVGGRFVLDGGAGHPDGAKPFSRDVGPAVAGRVTDLVVHVVFSRDPATGRVDVRQDGTPRVADLHPPGGTLYPGLGGSLFSYWRLGVHRDADLDAAAVLDLTDARVGRSEAAVSTPTP